MIFYPVISLRPAFSCVQLYTVSNTLLCPPHYCVQKILFPHLPKCSFVHFSHFNVLRSYHAALAKHPYFLGINFCFPFDVKLLFFGSEHLGNDENNDIFLKMQKYFLRSKILHFISTFLFFSCSFHTFCQHVNIFFHIMTCSVC